MCAASARNPTLHDPVHPSRTHRRSASTPIGTRSVYTRAPPPNQRTNVQSCIPCTNSDLDGTRQSLPCVAPQTGRSTSCSRQSQSHMLTVSPASSQRYGLRSSSRTNRMAGAAINGDGTQSPTLLRLPKLARTEFRGHARGHAPRKRAVAIPPGRRQAQVHLDITAQRNLQGRTDPAQATYVALLRRSHKLLFCGVYSIFKQQLGHPMDNLIGLFTHDPYF